MQRLLNSPRVKSSLAYLANRVSFDLPRKVGKKDLEGTYLGKIEATLLAGYLGFIQLWERSKSLYSKALESGIQLKESGISPTIGISSSHKECRIHWNRESKTVLDYPRYTGRYDGKSIPHSRSAISWCFYPIHLLLYVTLNQSENQNEDFLRAISSHNGPIAH